jgi:hypothetical protein
MMSRTGLRGREYGHSSCLQIGLSCKVRVRKQPFLEASLPDFTLSTS